MTNELMTIHEVSQLLGFSVWVIQNNPKRFPINKAVVRINLRLVRYRRSVIEGIKRDLEA